MQNLLRFLRDLLDWFRAALALILTNRTISSGWDRVIVDPTPLLDNLRQQVADVASGGSRRFAIVYIISTSTSSIAPTGDSQTDIALPFEPAIPDDMGELRFAHFDVDTDLKTAPEAFADVKAAGWVRAATGGPVEQRNRCPLEVQFFGSSVQVPLLRNSEFITFFALGTLDNILSPSADLLRVQWCSSRMTKTLIHIAGDGLRPSVAIGRRDSQTKLLYVYGRDNQLLGLFLNLEGQIIGSEFVLATFPRPQSVQSTDVIWNAVGDHFIVGYMHREKAGIDSVSPDLCGVRNVRVSWDGTADEPRLHGACDPRRGGHHTSVDYDDRLNANPNGIYAWWYQGIDDGKGIRMMDASGEPTGNRVDIKQTEWTYPVTARREVVPPRALEFVFGQPSGSYTVAARKSPLSGSEQRMSAWTFETNSNLHSLGLLGATPQGADPVAIEALDTASVTVWRTSREEVTPIPWGLSVFSHTPKLVATSES